MKEITNVQYCMCCFQRYIHDFCLHILFQIKQQGRNRFFYYLTLKTTPGYVVDLPATSIVQSCRYHYYIKFSFYHLCCIWYHDCIAVLMPEINIMSLMSLMSPWDYVMTVSFPTDEIPSLNVQRPPLNTWYCLAEPWWSPPWWSRTCPVWARRCTSCQSCGGSARTWPAGHPV